MRKKLKDYFIPHEGNDYKPHSLQKAAVTGMAFMVLFSFALTNLQSILWLSSDWLVSTILPAVIVEMTNEERAAGALGSVRRSAILDRAATLKAQDMATKQYFSHNSPSGVTPWYWFGQAGYTFVHAGENLAIHFTDSGDVVEAWMESPTHRANIMNGNYTEIGVGTAEGEYEGFKTVYVVQLFGTPAAAATVAGENTAVEPPPPPPATPPVVIAQAESEPEETVVLAETAAVTEIVERSPADVEEVVIDEELPATNATKTEIVDVTVTDAGVALYSDFVSTSTGGIPATIEPEKLTDGAPSPAPNWLGRMLTRPHIVLEVLYSLTALFVLIALLLAIFIEIRRQEPIQVAYALMLLFLMYGLFELHTLLSGGALVV